MIIGYAYVVGDLLHVGHLLHLQNCKHLCDQLIVGVLTDEAAMDKKDRPIVSFDDRIRLVSQLKPVDATVPQMSYSPLTNLVEIRPDILFECQSHEQRSYPEFNGRVMSMPYYPGRSSTAIKEKIRDNGTQRDNLVDFDSLYDIHPHEICMDGNEGQENRINQGCIY